MANSFDQFDNTFDQFDAGFDNTPVQLPPPVEKTFGGGLVPEFTTNASQFTDEERELAAAGIDVSGIGAGVPGSRTKASFATNDAVADELIRQGLSKKHGQEIKLAKMPNGKTGYVNPETNRLTPIDEAGLSVSDFTEILGGSLPLIGAAAGEIAGGVPGAFAGGFTGESVRRLVGGLIGANEESLGEGFVGSAKEGAIAGTGSAVFRGVASTVKGARDIIRPKPNLTLNEAKRAADDIAEHQAIADEISEATGRKFQPLASQLTDDAALAGQQAKLASNPATAGRQRAQIKENESVLEDYFDQITPQGGDAQASGIAAQRSARQTVSERTATADSYVDDAVNRLESALDEIPRTSDAAQGRVLREEVLVARKALKDAEEAAYRDAERAYGWSPDAGQSAHRVPINTEMRLRINEFNLKVDRSIFAGQGGRTAFAIPKLKPGQTDLDLHQVEEALQFLNGAAQGQLTPSGIKASGVDLLKMKTALERARDKALKDHPEVLDKILAADRATIARARLSDKALFNSLLVPDEFGGYVLNSNIVSNVIGNGDAEAAKQLHRLLSRNPEGVAKLQNVFLQFYKNEVERDRVLNFQLHKDFVRKHGNVMDEVFPVQKDKVAKFGEMASVVEARTTRANNFTKALTRTFEGRLKNSNPEDIAQEFFTKKFSVKDAKRMRDMAEAGGYKEQFDLAMGDQMRRLFKTGDSFSLTKMTTNLDKHEDVITGYFGARYYQNLQKLNKALTVQRTVPAAVSDPPPSTLIGVWRVIYARPLSPQGVATTVAQRVRKRIADRAMEKILNDPNRLQAFINLKEKDLLSQNVAGFLGAVGASPLLEKAQE